VHGLPPPLRVASMSLEASRKAGDGGSSSRARAAADEVDSSSVGSPKSEKAAEREGGRGRTQFHGNILPDKGLKGPHCELSGSRRVLQLVPWVGVHTLGNHWSMDSSLGG
jgi:hypothetical protein